MSTHKKGFDENIERVDSLIALYSTLKEEDLKEKDYKNTDVLRAAVVFLHASFEEYFRNVLIEQLQKYSNKEAVKGIPLSIEGKKGTKYSLYDLLDCKGKTVDEIFSKSLGKYMSHTSFNDYGEVCKWMEKIKLNNKLFTSQQQISKAMQRRHQIVHEADRRYKKGGKSKDLRGISDETVRNWKNAYIALVEVIDKQLVEQEEQDDDTPNL